MALKRMQIINFHDDDELQCYVSVTVIEEKSSKSNRCFGFWQTIRGMSCKGSALF